MYGKLSRISVLLLISVFLFIGVFAFSEGKQEEQGAAEGPETMLTTYATMANDFFLTFDQGAREAVEALGNEYIAATDDRKPEKFI